MLENGVGLFIHEKSNHHFLHAMPKKPIGN